MTKDEKAKAIARVKAALPKALVPAFEEYAGNTRNPHLGKYLEDANTDWKAVLAKAKKAPKKEAKSVYELLKALVDANTYDSLKEALEVISKLQEKVQAKLDAQKQSKIDALKAELAELEGK